MLTTLVTLACMLVQPPALHREPAVAPHVASAWAGVVIVVLVVAVSTWGTRTEILVPALVALSAGCMAFNTGVLASVLLFELLLVSTRGVTVWVKVLGWTYGVLVNLALVLPALATPGWTSVGTALLIQGVPLSLVAVWWGENLRRLDAEKAAVESRAAARELAVLRARDFAEVRASQAVSAEREQLAQDLHDLVAGRLAAISLQASTAQLSPDGREAALLSLRTCADTTLAQLRVLIDRLSGDGTAESCQVARGYFEETVRVATALGMDLTISDLPDCESDSELGVIFVVAQEALINMLLHASPCRGRIDFRRTAGWLELQAVNALGAPTGPRLERSGSGGHGLRNMTRRVTAAGGALQYGPTPDGSAWLVCARVPVFHPGPVLAGSAGLPLPADDRRSFV